MPASGEGDLKTCLAMLILDRFDAGGSFTEFYAMDFRENFVLMGHDGPAHLAISGQRPVLRGFGPLPRQARPRRQRGVQRKARTGYCPRHDADRRRILKLLTAEGVSEPGPILKIGNTNSRLRFPLGPREFVNSWCQEGPTHHCALGIGHKQSSLAKLGELIGLPVKNVC